MVTGAGPVGAIRSGKPVAGGGGKEVILAGTKDDVNFNNYRSRSIGATGNFRFDFFIPFDFAALVSVGIFGFPNMTNAAASIDYTTEYCGIGELFNNHTQSAVGGTESYILNTLFEFDISSVLTSISAGDRVGLMVDHNAIGGINHYMGIRLAYT